MIRENIHKKSIESKDFLEICLKIILIIYNIIDPHKISNK